MLFSITFCRQTMRKYNLALRGSQQSPKDKRRERREEEQCKQQGCSLRSKGPGKVFLHNWLQGIEQDFAKPCLHCQLLPQASSGDT